MCSENTRKHLQACTLQKFPPNPPPHAKYCRTQSWLTCANGHTLFLLFDHLLFSCLFHLSVRLSIHPSIFSFIRSSVCSSVHPSVCLSICELVHPSIHPFDITSMHRWRMMAYHLLLSLGGSLEAYWSGVTLTHILGQSWKRLQIFPSPLLSYYLPCIWHIQRPFLWPIACDLQK